MRHLPSWTATRAARYTAWSLCSIAAAQTPDLLPPTGTEAPADVAAATADLVQTDSAALTTGTLYMCKFENDSPLYTISPATGIAILNRDNKQAQAGRAVAP